MALAPPGYDVISTGYRTNQFGVNLRAFSITPKTIPICTQISAHDSQQGNLLFCMKYHEYFELLFSFF